MKKLLAFTIAVFLIAFGYYIYTTNPNVSETVSALLGNVWDNADSIKDSVDTLKDSVLESSVTDYDESVLGSEYHFYYSTLSDDDKKIYRALYYMIDQKENGITLATDDVDNVTRIQQLLILDNPQFYYFEKSKYTLGTQLVFSPELSMTDSEQTAAKTSIDNYVTACMAGISDDMTQYDKALHFFEYIVESTDYEENAPHNQDLYSVVLKKTVCQGYSMMFKYLCDQVGIESIIVTGQTADANHAWNMACLDGVWCCIDCTYADSNYLDQNISYSWFGVTSDVISLTRTVDNQDVLPTADSCANDYYYRNGIYFDSYSLSQLKELALGKKYITFKFSNKEAYDTACTQLFDQKEYEYLVNSPNGGTIQYLQEPNSLTLFLQIQLG